MRVLLDEQLPRQLAPLLVGHQVQTVQQVGWSGLTNGELLRRAKAAGFEVLLSADQNLEFQQNLHQAGLGVVLIRAASNALEDLEPLVSSILTAIHKVHPGQVIRVSA